MKKSLLWGSLLLVFGLLVFQFTSATRQANVSSTPQGGDFVLQSADGVVDSKTLRGNVLLVYFGYANCPDICPASLANGGQALNALSEAERSKVKMLMISVDPARDTPAKLKEYAAYFHPSMLGLTGTPNEIAALTKAFGAGYVIQPAKADGSYAIDHSANTYVVGLDGKLAATLTLNAPVSEILTTIRELL